MSDSLFDFLPGAVEPSHDCDDLALTKLTTTKLTLTTLSTALVLETFERPASSFLDQSPD